MVARWQSRNVTKLASSPVGGNSRPVCEDVGMTVDDPADLDELRRLVEQRHISSTWRADGEGMPIAWRINREIVVMLGWGPAVLMQLAHPLVATGIAEHSAFLNQPGARVRRLHQTISAMLMLTFGTPEQIATTAATINRLHDDIHGQIAE